ncbi:hypothetical protein AX14_008302 [Amanita brunnescens Koide BX004]|nr:hypothetical protein AX14_008302 [Amanita brunnescens Koide BX004]
MQVKDGAAWASLEYLDWLKKNSIERPEQDVRVIPVAIVYTNKSKYRSAVIMEFGRPITMDDYRDEFFSVADGSRRSAVKRLTRTIEMALVEMTINAPDWDTLYAAKMARDLLWEGQNNIDLDDFVLVSQTLVDLFSTRDATSNVIAVRRHLLEYYSLLQSSYLTNSVLSSLPLPNSLDPHTYATLPSRLLTLLILLKDTVSAISRLPFFLLPLLIHLPVYFMGRLGASLVEDEEETQAQNKVAFGLLSFLLIYPATFFFLWALLHYTSLGAVLAAFTVYLFAWYHDKVIDDAYTRAKRIIAAWRVLVGVWAPKRWDMSLSALSQYTTPRTPPGNPWIDRPRDISPSNSGHEEASGYINNTQAKPRPPPRRIVRHLLRARADAVKALASFFDQLEKDQTGKRIKASARLARLYGFTDVELGGWRYVREVTGYLKARGARIPSGNIEGWAADGYTTTEEQEQASSPYLAMSSRSADSAPSFAETLREQDELFYAVFPQARSNEYCFDFHIGHGSYVLSLSNISSEPPTRLPPQKYTPCPSIAHHQARINRDDPIDVVNAECVQRTVNVDHTSGDVDRPIHESPLESSFAPSSSTTQHSPQLAPNIQNRFPLYRPDGPRRRQSHPFLMQQQQQNDKLPIRLQQSKRTTDKKPALACLFCRGRKIACGPPVAGTKEKTCGQCQRRSLTCVFPSESRRGMRKKNIISLNAEGANIPQANM